jgi:hypothetical protein
MGGASAAIRRPVLKAARLTERRERGHAARPMIPSMILTMPFQTTAGNVRRLRISLPLVPDLLDGQKYFLPEALPAPVGEELRPIMRPRIASASSPPAPRPARQAWSERDLAEVVAILGPLA